MPAAQKTIDFSSLNNITDFAFPWSANMAWKENTTFMSIPKNKISNQHNNQHSCFNESKQRLFEILIAVLPIWLFLFVS